jgi:hypothetical protein
MMSILDEEWMGELNLSPSEEVAEEFAESHNERCPAQGRG